ncbi:MAG: hypothetical protein A3K46_02915 [Chloroflexi bacterium RBG_13_60_9]|nr:MAG: hypothetical protein A3K46_02915 [Chloroflexi bacterium RBG_13_60_9]
MFCGAPACGSVIKLLRRRFECRRLPVPGTLCYSIIALPVFHSDASVLRIAQRAETVTYAETFGKNPHRG